MSSSKLNSVSSDPEIGDGDSGDDLRAKGHMPKSSSASELKYMSIDRQANFYDSDNASIPDVRVPMDELLSEEYVTRLDQDLEFVENIMKELLKCKQRIDECTFLESRRPKIYPSPPAAFPNIFPV
jgi:hypothetical protein